MLAMVMLAVALAEVILAAQQDSIPKKQTWYDVVYYLALFFNTRYMRCSTAKVWVVKDGGLGAL